MTIQTLMKSLAFLALCALTTAPAPAQTGPTQPGPPPIRMVPADPLPQPGAIPLYPAGTLPRSKVVERWERTTGEVGGMTFDSIGVRNVTQPTITPVLPDPAKATGAAVIVAPGGAFQALAIDHEGFKVARRLADNGIAAFVLKYRVNETPDDVAGFMRRMGGIMAEAGSGKVKPSASEPRATQDALQALRLVRSRASEWNVDPARVGMIGFSAGAMTAMQAVLTGKAEERPSFFGYIYGPMEAVAVPTGAPPMFAAIALDDGLFGRQGFGIVEAWQQAGRPVELHAYERGEHGFGLGRPGTTTALMLDQFLAWLQARGVLTASTPNEDHR